MITAFQPQASFSIHHFDYDSNRLELRVHYYDGRRKVCSGIAPAVAVLLRISSRPESVLQAHADSTCREE